MAKAFSPYGDDLRRWAMQCAARAQSAASPFERNRLLSMRDSLLHLADNEDWLAGETQLVSQPSDFTPRADSGHDRDLRKQA